MNQYDDYLHALFFQRTGQHRATCRHYWGMDFQFTPLPPPPPPYQSESFSVILINITIQITFQYLSIQDIICY